MFWISLMQQWPIPSFSLPGISKSTKSEEASKKIGPMISGTFEVFAALVLPRVRNHQLRHGHHNVPLSDQPFVFLSGQDSLGRCCRCKKSSSNVSAPVSLTMTSLVKAHGLQIELDKCIM
jgi:hypothetical protein